MGRSRTAASKVSEEEMIKLKVVSELQMDVLAAVGGGDQPPWAFSLFGNPNDHETQE